MREGSKGVKKRKRIIKIGRDRYGVRGIIDGGGGWELKNERRA